MVLLIPDAPPLQEQSRSRRMWPPLATIAALGAATTAVALRDPHVQGSWGACPSALLGFSCPGCGGLRGVYDLTHLQVGQALSSNLLVMVLIPFVVFLLGRWAWDAWRGYRRPQNLRLQRVVMVGLLVAIAAFTLLRNLPAGAWLAP